MPRLACCMGERNGTLDVPEVKTSGLAVLLIDRGVRYAEPS